MGDDFNTNHANFPLQSGGSQKCCLRQVTSVWEAASPPSFLKGRSGRGVAGRVPQHALRRVLVLHQLHLATAACHQGLAISMLFVFGSHQGPACDTWLAGFRAVTMESGFWPQENKPETAGTLWHDDDPALKPQGYQLCGS